MVEQTSEGVRQTTTSRLPAGKLSTEFQNLAMAAAERMVSSLANKVEGLTGRLTDYVEHGGSGLLSALTGKEGGPGLLGAITGGGEGKSHPVRAALFAYAKEKVKGVFGGAAGHKKLKLTNIVESLDFGAPNRLVYNVWTQFEDWPTFTKKVEKVVQESDEKLTWQVQIFLPRRTWESTIIEQVPDEKIIWRSKAAKGYVDGAVTFHAVTPDMTRVLMVLEYHPKGLVEHIGNLWRAQGRRARLEFKHVRRHIMTEVLPHPEGIEGWRGVIHDGEVVKDHETALREEQEREEAEERVPEEAVEGAPEEAPEEAAEEAPEREAGEEGEPREEVPEEEKAPEEEPEEEEEPEYAAARPAREARPARPAREAREARPARATRAAPVPRARRRGEERSEGETEEYSEPAEPPLRRRRAPVAAEEQPGPATGRRRGGSRGE